MALDVFRNTRTHEKIVRRNWADPPEHACVHSVCVCVFQVKQQRDSLKRSRSRLNAYKALASPAYMALSSPDPITTTFELRQEMKRVAQVEKEFRVRKDHVGFTLLLSELFTRVKS